MSPEQISAIATTVAAGSLVFLAWQALSTARQAGNIRRQTIADHERSRRQKAVELMQYWTERVPSLLPGLIVRDMVEELSAVQCENIYLGKPITVETRYAPLIEAFLASVPYASRSVPAEKVGVLQLDEYQVLLIHRHVSAYLNVLETVATAWRHNVADREIIEEEFHGLFVRGKHRFRLEEFRKATGVYPSIDAFVTAMKAKNNGRLQKAPVS